ncbi:MAG: serpin family protein [Gemmatales bacterium]|nr:serpin family protein [Gemmatales bacterium]MDW7994170.1 serpin family protein [Gemmatales bacterium]
MRQPSHGLSKLPGHLYRHIHATYNNVHSEGETINRYQIGPSRNFQEVGAMRKYQRLWVHGNLITLALASFAFLLTWQHGVHDSPAQAQEKTDQAKSDLHAIAQANTEFAFDLYHKLRERQGNVFFSPFSISTALAMTSAGARGNTLAQMEKTLHFPFEQKRLHEAFGSLLQQSRSGKGYQLHVANALWCQEGVPFREEFLSLNEKYYGAKPFAVDYINNTELARRAINEWVEKQTQNKIKELIKPGVLSNLTRLVLTNAIYFKGDWAIKFDPAKTREEPFFVSLKESVKVPMMYQSGQFPFFWEAGVRGIELPYAGKDVTMVLFVTDQLDGLPEFEKSLSAEKLQQLLSKLRMANDVDVFLPRFRVTSEFQLQEELKALGMKDAFEAGQADFSGISPEALSQKWHISAVVHKAFVEVNEEGTEAAAATGVIIKAVALPPSFRADRPFFFLIRDKRTNSILFMGRITNPQS